MAFHIKLGWQINGKSEFSWLNAARERPEAEASN
jgi:hypothetical protein